MRANITAITKTFTKLLADHNIEQAFIVNLRRNTIPDCPDELQSYIEFIVNRHIESNSIRRKETLQSAIFPLIFDAFNWGQTPEEGAFWYSLHEEWTTIVIDHLDELVEGDSLNKYKSIWR